MSCDEPRKLPENLECPIDNLVYKVVEPLSDMFHSLSATPNQITSLSLIFGLIAIYFLVKRNITYFVIAYIVSYILDCVDGYYARKYEMCSEFGDFYDHIKDITIIAFVIYIIFKHCLHKRKYIPILIILFVMYMSLFQMGCQQLCANCGTSNSNSINGLKKLCPSRNWIKITRLFGVGTMNLVIILIVMYLFKSKR